MQVFAVVVSTGPIDLVNNLWLPSKTEQTYGTISYTVKSVIKETIDASVPQNTVLSLTAKPWKQPRCLWIEQINEFWYIMEWHKAIKMKKLQPHTPVWTNLKGIMLHDLQKIYIGWYSIWIKLKRRSKRNNTVLRKHTYRW